MHISFLYCMQMCLHSFILKNYRVLDLFDVSTMLFCILTHCALVRWCLWRESILPQCLPQNLQVIRNFLHFSEWEDCKWDSRWVWFENNMLHPPHIRLLFPLSFLDCDCVDLLFLLLFRCDIVLFVWGESVVHWVYCFLSLE